MVFGRLSSTRGLLQREHCSSQHRGLAWVDLCAAQLVERLVTSGSVSILPSDLVEVSEVDTESQGAILLLSKEDGCTAWRLRRSDEPLASMSSRNSRRRRALAREW